MADDIATIGYAVDTRGLQLGGKALDDFKDKNDEAADAAQSLGEATQRSAPAIQQQGRSATSAAEAHERAATATQRHNQAIQGGGAGAAQYTAAQQRVVKALQEQIAAIQLGGREFAVHSALTRANTTAGTEAGKVISALALKQYDLDHAMENSGDKISEQRVKFRALAEAAGLAGGPLGEVIQKAGFLTIGSQHLTIGLIGATVALGLIAKGLEKLVELLKEAAVESDTLHRIGLGGQLGQGLSIASQYAGNTSKDFVQGMVKFNEQVALAKVGVGALGQLFAANGIVVKDTEDAFFKLAELVRGATGDFDKQQQFLTQAGLPATREMAKFMEQGAAAIRAQASAARTFSDEQEHTAQDFEKRWNKLTTDLSQWFKASLISVADFPAKGTPLGDLVEMLRGGRTWKLNLDIQVEPGSVLDDLRKWIFAHASVTRAPVTAVERGGDLEPPLEPHQLPHMTVTPGPIDPERLKAQLELEKQRLAMLGQTATVAQQVRSAELSLQIAAISGTTATKEQIEAWNKQSIARLADTAAIRGQMGAVMSLAREQATGVYALKAQTDAARIQAETVGMSAGAAAEYTAVQTKLAEAIRNRAPLDAASEAALRRQGAALRAAAQAGAERAEADKANFDLQAVFLSDIERQIAQVQRQLHGNAWPQFMNDGLAATMRLTAALSTIKGGLEQFASSLTKDLLSGVNGITALENAAKSLANTLVDSLVKKIIDQALSGAFSGIAGGLGQGAGMTAGATSAASILTTAGASVGASIVAAATEAASLLGLGGGTVAAEVATSGAAAGAELASGGAAAGVSLVAGATALDEAAAAIGVSTGNVIAVVAAVAAIAAAVGLNMLGGQGKKDEELKKAQKAWFDLSDRVAQFSATLAGGTGGGLSGQIRQINKDFMELAKAAYDAKDFASAAMLVQQTIAAYVRLQGDFRASFEGMLQAMKDGTGPDGPFTTGATKMKDLTAKVKDFVADTTMVYSNALAAQHMGIIPASGPTDASAQIAAAQEAGRAMLLVQLSGVKVLSDVAAQIAELDGKTVGLQQALVDLGLSADQAASAIAAARAQGVAKITKDFVDGITRSINEAVGKSYVNDLNDLIASTAQKRADAVALGVDPALIDRYFTVTAQKIVDGAGLVGDSFGDLLGIFPNLTGVVHESTEALQAQIDEQKRFYQQLQKDIADFMAGLQFGAQSTLSPAAQFAASQSDFNAQASAALAGDKDAQSNLTKFAQAYLEQARNFLGPSEAYGAVYSQVTGQLQALLAIAKTGAATGTVPGMAAGGIVGSFAGGGLIGNGLFGVDSVLARYAGGGSVALAGSEYVMPAAQTSANLPALDAMRSGRGGGGVEEVAEEVKALRQDGAALRADLREALRALRALAESGNAAAGAILTEVRGLRVDARLGDHEQQIRKRDAG